jgi:hypothetical protein
VLAGLGGALAGALALGGRAGAAPPVAPRPASQLRYVRLANRAPTIVRGILTYADGGTRQRKVTPAVRDGEAAELVYPHQATDLEFEIEQNYQLEWRRIAFSRPPYNANWCFTVTNTAHQPHVTLDVCPPVGSAAARAVARPARGAFPAASTDFPSHTD